MILYTIIGSFFKGQDDMLLCISKAIKIHGYHGLSFYECQDDRMICWFAFILHQNNLSRGRPCGPWGTRWSCDESPNCPSQTERPSSGWPTQSWRCSSSSGRPISKQPRWHHWNLLLTKIKNQENALQDVYNFLAKNALLV